MVVKRTGRLAHSIRLENYGHKSLVTLESVYENETLS